MITEVMSMSVIALEAVGILCMSVARKGTEGGLGVGGVSSESNDVMRVRITARSWKPH